MKVTFNSNYGVFEKGKTYEVPDALAQDLIDEKHVCRREGQGCAGSGTEAHSCCKNMKSSQVSRKGGA